MENESIFQKLKIAPVATVIFFVAVFIFSTILIFTDSKKDKKPDDRNPQKASGINNKITSQKLLKFTSEADFKLYLQNSDQASSYFGGGALNIGTMRNTSEMPTQIDSMMGKSETSMAALPERSSTTNVQVLGIDEPDIVKNDGSRIYFSSDMPIYKIMPMREIVTDVESNIYPPENQTSRTKIIKAFPPEQLTLEGNIAQTGDLLLKDRMLIISNYQGMSGFDISDPKNPKESWKLELAQNYQIHQSRIYNDKLYLITGTYINRGDPCPVQPFISSNKMIIPCTDIYYPERGYYEADTTYTAMKVNPATGIIEEKITFIGSSSNSTVYMSRNALYVTYSYRTDYVDFMYGFLDEKARDLLPEDIKTRLNNLRVLDISSQAKLVEYQNIISSHTNTLDENQRLKWETDLNNRLNDYYKDHKRELEKTGIVKIGLNNFNLQANGVIPGHPLNQFSLDEYENHLRIAVTVQGAAFNSSGSANDVYVLDSNLRETGKVIDLGLDERIYSVRFLGNKGYVVTFKQVDPFFVLDLKDPGNPKLSGQLKIPGYSSYLHPLDDNNILGIGKEGQNLKISIFNVSDPQNPTEADKYMLNDYYSDILSNHHAFLLDSKHQIFFLPGNEGGYVLSYKNNKLSLEATVAGYQVKRALYLNDYLYIIGENKITVFDETTWKEINHLDL